MFHYDRHPGRTLDFGKITIDFCFEDGDNKRPPCRYLDTLSFLEYL